jgi:hypothetical protein
MNPRHLLAVSAGVLFGATSLSADTLVLQNGRRVNGDLVSANQTTVVFDARPSDSRRASRRMRVNTSEVQRIVFTEGTYTNDDETAVDPWGDDVKYPRNDPRNDPYGRGDQSGSWGRNDRQFTVDASRQWTDTGLNVRAGETLYFDAEGTVMWGNGRQDTAAGEDNSPYNRNRPIPGRPAGALIGRIGTETFFIGDERAPFRVNNTGRLYLGINDDYLQDNSGAFRVTVRH